MIASSLVDTGIMDVIEAQAFAFQEIADVGLQPVLSTTSRKAERSSACSRRRAPLLSE